MFLDTKMHCDILAIYSRTSSTNLHDFHDDNYLYLGHLLFPIINEPVIRILCYLPSFIILSFMKKRAGLSSCRMRWCIVLILSLYISQQEWTIRTSSAALYLFYRHQVILVQPPLCLS